MPACMFRISLRPFVIWVPCKNDARFERGRCAQAGILPYSISRLRIGGISQSLRVGSFLSEIWWAQRLRIHFNDAWTISWSFSRDRFFLLKPDFMRFGWLNPWPMDGDSLSLTWSLHVEMVYDCLQFVALQTLHFSLRRCWWTLASLQARLRQRFEKKTETARLLIHVSNTTGIKKEAACDPCREIL